MGLFADLLGQPDEQAPEPLTTPATQAPQQPKSLFHSLTEPPDAGALHTNLAGAAATTPDAHQKAVDDGKTLDIPADVAARNRAETEKQARIQRYRDALNDAPKMAALLAEDPDLAKISSDDLDKLSQTESTLGKLLSAFYGTTPGVGQVIADSARAFPAGGLEGTGIAMEGVAALNDVIGRTAARGYRAVGLDTLGDLADPATRPLWLNPSAIFGAAGTELRDVGKAVGPDESRQNIATDIAGGLGQVAAQIATAMLTGGTASTASMFSQGAGILAERVEEQGKTGTVEGDAAIVMGASVTALTEKLGLDALLHRVPPAIRNGILRTLVDIGIGGGIEAVQEVTEGILHNLIAMVTIDPNAKLLEGVEQDATAAGGTGAVIRALINAATKGRQIQSNVQRQQRAGQDAATVEALVTGTAESKLRDRNPDAFSRVMAAQTQGTPVETFYVPATAIAELYQDGAGSFDDDPLNQIDGLREQFQEALAVGGDVEISAADYLTHIAPTDVHGRLKNDLRASRDGWSVNDAKAYSENPDREADLAKLVEELAIKDENAAVGRTVFDDTYRQLMDTGQYQSHQAAVEAHLNRDRYLAKAKRRGLDEDPDALYLRDQLKIHGPGALARVRRGDLDLVIARLKSGETVTADKTPVLDIVRKAGGVKPGSNLAGELQHMGITARTHPGLFRKTGIGDVDNFVLSEHDVLADNGVPDSGNGYADRDAVLEALRREAGGRGAALLTQDERQQQTRLDEPVAVLAEQMEAAGLDPASMTADEIRAWATGQQTAETGSADGQGVLLQAAPAVGGVDARGAAYEDPQRQSRPAHQAGGTPGASDVGDTHNQNMGAADDGINLTVEQSAGGNGVRGSFTPKRSQDPHSDPANIIKLTQNADLSTFLHEAGHFYLFQLIDDATDADVPPEARAKLQADLQTILDHVGVKIDVATASADQIHAVMTRDAHELWARSFEVYLREGKAPSASLRDAFASFSAWLTRIYKTLKAIPDYRKNLTPEVRGVMDRLLATDEAIADAQNASSFRVPGALRQVMTAAEQKSLERLTEQANREAKEDLLQRVMREMERERLEWWKEERAKVRTEVEAEVMRRPVYRAYNIIRSGKTADGGQLVDENGEPRTLKMDRKQLERDYGKDVIKLLPKGLTTKDGASHHVVAGMVGFGSTDELRDALMNFRPMKEVVEEETDAAMKARHGDMLSDGRLAEDAAELVLNERQLELAALQAKALRRLASSVVKKAAGRLASEQGVQSRADDAAAVSEAQRDVEAVANAGAPAEAVAGLQVEQAFAEAFQGEAVPVRRAQGAALRQVRSIQTGLDLKAIQAAAKRAIAGKRIEDAQPGKYRAQADRLGRQIEDAIAKRDYETAAQLKEQQLINLALAKEAQEAQARVEKAVKRFSRLNKPDAKLAKTQNIDFVGAVRAILSQFGLSRPQAGYDQQVWFQRLREDSPADEVLVRDMIDDATKIAGTVAARGRTRTRQQRPGGSPVAMGQIWRQMTVAEFRDLTDTVDAILHMGRESRTAEIDGERVERKQINADLTAQASNRDTGKRIGQTAAITGMDKAALVMGSMAAASERAEHWARRMDLDDTNGPFTRYFIKPIMAAVYAYREDKAARLKALVDIIEPRKKDLFGKKIHSDELNYTFGNKGELLHAILHTGNDSNMRKLLLGGRGKGFAWGKAMPDGTVDRSRWDSMIRRLVQEGVLTKADFDTAQQIWDLLESTKGPAQIAWRKMKGYYFQEVEITGINTPFGRYKGGYVPALTEADMNADGGQRSDADAIGQIANAGMMATVDAGFTKSRVEYNEPLQLNLMKLPSHLDKVLKMTHLGPAVQQAGRLASNRDFKDLMFGIDQTIIEGMLMPWLGRVARQSVELPSTTKAGRYVDVFFRGLRKHTGLQAMAGNVINALQQILGPIPALTEVKPAAMMRGLIANVRRPWESVAVITSKSAFMKDRMNGASQELMGTLDDIINNKRAYGKLKKMGERHGYFAQTFVQNLVDRVVWQGGYDQAIAAGKSEADAVFDADSAVRITQGSFAPEDVSAAEAKIAFSRLFTQFYSYFNTQLNLARSKADITVQELGWVGGSPKLFYIYALTVMVPAVLGDAIAQASRGTLGDDDDDGLLDDMAELFFMSQLRYMGGMIPGAGQFVNYLIARSNDNPADDRISTSPALNALETVGRAPFTIWDAVVDDGKASKAIQDGLTAIGVITGLPLGQAGKRLGYVADVATGEQEGDSLGDWARGLLSGREAPKQ